EPASQGHLSDRDCRVDEKALCPLDALPQDILVRRQAGALLERAEEVKNAHLEDVGEVHKREIGLEVLVDIPGDEPQPVYREAAAILAKILPADGLLSH